MFKSTSAMPDMPMPPTPTKWTCWIRLNNSLLSFACQPLHQIDRRRGGVAARERARGLFHPCDAVGVFDQVAYLLRQPLARRVLLQHHAGGAGPLERLGVLALVVVRGEGERHHERSLAGGDQLGRR